jgi:sigma-B regulation protein RsbU (phosphoserine phosphatase)
VSRVGLRQILGRGGTRAMVDAVAAAVGPGVAVEDTAGRPLAGEAAAGAAVRLPVTNDGAPLGWVSGPAGAHVVATLLDHLVTGEVERKALGGEVLHLYREINLIYSFSEKLAALLDVERVAELTLREARHLIVATDGAVMLLDDAGALATVAGFGDELPSLTGFHAGVGIVGAIAASGNGEIVNDVDADPRRITQGTALKALIAAPLKVGERVLGVLALASTMPMSYTAAELKLLSTLGLQAATAIENARLFERTVHAAAERESLLRLQQETEVARAKLESELSLAARIQQDLFPAELPALAGYDLAAHNRPARQCGGDYYDAIAGDDGRVLLCVADVSGKGLPAALVMSNMQATLRALLGRQTSLPELATDSSALLFASTAPEKYVTAALVGLDPASGAARFVGAGHVDTLILRASGEAVTLTSTGTPLGLLPPGIPFGETPQHLAPGDTLVLFSDGVPEAQNMFDEEFGEARLLDVLREARGGSAAAIIAAIITAIDEFVGGAPQFDDITLMVLRRLDPAQP